MTDLVGFVGPTALQVGASLAAAICWGIQNPKSGANLPEHIPSDVVVNLARPWLGKFVSVRHDWKPVETPRPPRPLVNSPPAPRSPVADASSSSDSDDEDDSSSDSDSFKDHHGNPRSRVASESPALSRSFSAFDEWHFCNFVSSGCDFGVS